MEQSDSQLMMAAQRGLSRLDARRSEHALLTWDHPGIEQQEIDGRPGLTSSASAIECSMGVSGMKGEVVSFFR